MWSRRRAPARQRPDKSPPPRSVPTGRDRDGRRQRLQEVSYSYSSPGDNSQKPALGLEEHVSPPRSPRRQRPADYIVHSWSRLQWNVAYVLAVKLEIYVQTRPIDVQQQHMVTVRP